MYQFNYLKPTSLSEAAAILAANSDAKLLAGGQTLIAAMKFRLASPSDLIDLNAIPDLKGIKVDGGVITIGAMTRHAEVARSEAIAKSIPALSLLAGCIGDRMIRNMGTLGGSVANNDPGADYPAAVVGLNATVNTNKRKIAADAFFTGMYETALAPDEVIVSVSFPIPKRAGYMKFRNQASRYALVGVMVSEGADGVRVAVTGAAPSVFRVPAMETALSSNFSAAALENIKVPAHDLSSDMHASADYRAHLVAVMAKRAVGVALG
ncbi:MAG: xanthine dehydrogenase family protein subunit M [Betaproteobacteria bacterium]